MKFYIDSKVNLDRKITLKSSSNINILRRDKKTKKEKNSFSKKKKNSRIKNCRLVGNDFLIIQILI